jgi:hypothetical protein
VRGVAASRVSWCQWGLIYCATDTIETYFDSRLDLLERRLKKHGDKLKTRAEEALKRTKSPMGEFRYSVDLEKEMQKFKFKVRMHWISPGATLTRLSAYRCRRA